MLAFYCTLIEDQQEKDKFTVIYERYRAASKISWEIDLAAE